MDIQLPDASTRIPLLQRNAGGRLFKTPSELNSFIQQVNAGGGINGVPLPLVSDDAIQRQVHLFDLPLATDKV